MKSKKITLQTIADALGISKVTVFKALNNHPGVSKQLKERIFQTASELGYSRETNKISFDLNKLAFIVPKRFFIANETFYTTIYHHLNELCIHANVILTLFVIENDQESTALLPLISTKDQYNGIFIAGEISDLYLSILLDLKLPTVLIDFYKPYLDLDCVITDNFYIGYYVTNYLLEAGHREIGFLGNPIYPSSITDRYFGYRKALASHNIEFNNNLSTINHDPVTGLYHLDCILPEHLPTAYVCHCDMAAYFLVQKLNSKNIRVPEDISIISFDNTDISVSTNPQLTSMDINKKEFATKAYEQMLSRIKDPTATPQRIYIQTNLVERSSIINILAK